MKKSLFNILMLCVAVCVNAHSATFDNICSSVIEEDSAKYWPVITNTTESAAHPVFFKLFSPGTLYGDAVKQAVFCDDETDDDPVLATNNAINSALIRSFISSPWLFTTTQTSISNQHVEGQLDLSANFVAEETKNAPVAVDETPVDISEDIDVDIVVEKPKFWSFDGSGGLQFTQTHFSDNWYQGGESNYSMLAMLTLHALYDNKQNLQWETTFDAKLGFQTVDNDEYRKLRVNNDQLRLTTKVGYKAFKDWFYTAQAEATTQMAKSYTPNTQDVISDIFSPIKTVLSVGMDYKFKYRKLSGSAYMAPVAMTWMYVSRLGLAERYGNKPDHHSRVTWGPNVTVNYTWAPWKNFSWTGRIYYFSNFEFVNLEWENTFTFNFNKYISAKMFLYPRFDDSSTKYRSEHGSYLMFKELLSVGLNYSF